MTETLDKIEARAAEAVRSEDFDKRVVFDFGEEGVLLVDGPARSVSRATGPADCTVKSSLADFVAVAKGALDPAKAFLRGRIKIEGDMGVALELARRLAGD